IMSGTQFLSRVKEAYPQIMRIILTGYTDVDSITQSINEGHIYKFFLKPWNDQHLTLEIRQALEQYDLIEENRRLYDMTVKQNEELRIINENLEAIVAERTQTLEMQNRALQLSHAMLEDLPVPIVGVSAELMIVFTNRAANEHFSQEGIFECGNTVLDYFEGLNEDQLALMMTARQINHASGRGKKSGTMYDLMFVPLTGHFHGKGTIMTVAPCAT
ncbi:MAG: PAS domain-containing protein, partial [Desulfobacteraceae bacterium]|nr:PAS domain-containing protein [Desulfobacteraceae bacterium]